MKHRITALLLAACLALPFAPDALAANPFGRFVRQNEYTPGQFADVPEGSALEDNVRTAWEYGLMKGQSEDCFGAGESLSRTAALIIACRVSSLYETGRDTIEADCPGQTRREQYLAYAAEHGIWCELPVWSGAVTRAEYARMLSGALPDRALPVMNEIEEDAIPDVQCADEAGAAVYRLYRAGILTGRDEYGSFGPDDAITRQAACAIAARMADQSLRRSVTLTAETKAAWEARQAQLAAEAAAREQARLDAAIAQVRTVSVGATVLYDTGLYADMYLSSKIGTIPAGTYACYFNYLGTSAAKIRLADGTTGWVPYYSIRISADNYVLASDYTEEQKAGFVNKQGYSSTTDYLVWVSLATQQVMVYTGSAGNWSLLHSFECCSGKNSTPTIGGVFSISYKQTGWDFGSYYVNTVVGFNGGHAFHTRTYVKSTGGLLDATMGRPASHGCVRMYDADVRWMYDNLPFGTTVVVY